MLKHGCNDHNHNAPPVVDQDVEGKLQQSSKIRSIPGMRMVDEEAKPEPLADHHIVLGHYNGKQTKALTPSTKIYKKFREEIPRKRTYKDQDIEDLRQQITDHIQNELGVSDLPLIQFVVDLQRIESLPDGRLRDAFWKTNPRVFHHQVKKGVLVKFVEDKKHIFFKKELEGHRPDCKRKANKRKANDQAVEAPEAQDLVASGPDAVDVEPITTQAVAPPMPDSVDMEPYPHPSSEVGVPVDDISFECNSDTLLNMDIESLQDEMSGGCSFSIGSTSLASKDLMKFEFVPGQGTLIQQRDQFCAQWLCDQVEGNLPDLNRLQRMQRKYEMLKSFQAHFDSYQQLLSMVNPFAHSPSPGLQGLSEELLIQCTTAMLNGMIEAHDSYPLSCLEGETNAWAAWPKAYGQSHPSHLMSGQAPFTAPAALQLYDRGGMALQESRLQMVAPQPLDDGPPEVSRSCGPLPSTIPSTSDVVAEDELISNQIGRRRVDPQPDVSWSRTSSPRQSSFRASRAGNSSEDDEEQKLIREVLAARSRDEILEDQIPTREQSVEDIENPRSSRSLSTSELHQRRVSWQQVLQMSQESARSIGAMQDAVRSTNRPNSHGEATTGRVAEATSAANQSEGEEEEDIPQVVTAMDERELHWIKRCQMRSEPLVSHMDIFSCHGQLYGTMASLRSNITWVVGTPVGFGLYFLFVEVPVFLFYLAFCGIVGVTCCLLFLVSFWEVNFWSPPNELECRDWGWKVPMFVAGSIGYLLATPLVLFSLMAGWTADYVCQRLLVPKDEDEDEVHQRRSAGSLSVLSV